MTEINLCGLIASSVGLALSFFAVPGGNHRVRRLAVYDGTVHR